MDNIPVDINDIIVRYLDGSATIEEKTELLQWLKHSEENRKDFTLTRELWLASEAVSDNGLEAGIALERFRRKLNSEHKQIPPPSRLSIKWYQAAAVILILFGLGFGTSRFIMPEKEILVQNQLITAKGSKGQFTLPDGSTVWLNSESKLSYPETFQGDKRIVNLEGEGYFEVVPNIQKPFIVKTDAMDVEVLGTAFDVSSYSANDCIETVLINGSVKISGSLFDHSVVLKPNQILSFNKSNKKALISATKARLHIDWIKERLIFDNDRLSDIIISMEGWYNVSIDCPKTFADNTRMSFTIRGENINEIIKAISLIIPVRYEIDHNHIKIFPK
ncbi:anti-sigma factor [Bacteroidia bacterium]|nr:anti-sigma factor [Bacteroidia bacterium]GHU58444.1 anti-sigma factor [Bacteroidia bacterium]GHV05102.1 anti-sigma factor [Bacteroidia bacterium]